MERVGAIEGLVLIVVFLVPAIWIYRDAKDRQMNGAFWALALLFTNVLGGLFIYLAIRDRFPSTRNT